MGFSILNIIGIILFLYLTWRNLRDNYKEGELIIYGWLVILFFLVGGRLAYGLINWGIWNNNWTDWFSFVSKPGISYIGGYATAIISSFFVSKLYGWKIWSLAEDVAPGFIIFLLFLLADNYLVSNLDLRIVVYFGILLVSLVTSFLLKKKYRSFVWYKSGKKGFIFFWANLIVWLLLGLSSIWFKDSVFHSIFYLAISLIFLVGLGILGEVRNKL